MTIRKPLSFDVPDIGRFSAAQRTFRDEIKIQVQTARLLDGEEDVPLPVRQFALMFATLSVLIQKAPTGFDLEALDPLDDASYIKLEGVFSALREAEIAFRGGIPAGGKAASAESVEAD